MYILNMITFKALFNLIINFTACNNIILNLSL